MDGSEFIQSLPSYRSIGWDPKRDLYMSIGQKKETFLVHIFLEIQENLLEMDYALLNDICIQPGFSFMYF